MERKRRKRPANGFDNGRKARAREDDGSQIATEDEVEEFFAILRRMHAAGKHFRHNNGNGLEITEKGEMWRPSFEWEDFAGFNAVKSNGESVTAGGVLRGGEGDKRQEEKTEENAFPGRLDLNVEPEPEHTEYSSG